MKIAGLGILSLLTITLMLAPIAGGASEQPNKMKACNEQANAKGLSEGNGEERKAFMKECLSAKPVKTAKPSQREKMKACNKEAGEKQLKGDERKKFMSTCLSS